MSSQAFIRTVITAPPTASVPLIWTAAPDAVAGYAMYYGETARIVTNRLDVGPVLQVTISNLTYAEHWFFVTAYDAVGTESLPSNTVVYTPPPNFPPDQVFTYTIQHWVTNNTWTNYLSVLATNPPGGMSMSLFRVALTLNQ